MKEGLSKFEEENIPNSPEKKEVPILQRCTHLVDSQEEGISLVKEFWQAMPHGNILTFPKNEEGWTKELTAGDRTRILPGRISEQRGKWLVIFQGNNQPLTKEAIRWLMDKKLIA